MAEAGRVPFDSHAEFRITGDERSADRADVLRRVARVSRMRRAPFWPARPRDIDLSPSAKRPKTEAADRLEVLSIAGDDSESMLDRRCGDQCIGKPDSELTGNASTTLGDCTIHGKLAKWGKKPNGEVGGRVAGNELGSRDH